MGMSAATPMPRQRLPRQIPYIIGNEACERFSFYGMRNILVQFLISSVRSEEHTSELQSLMRISYAVFCLKKKNKFKDKQRIWNTKYTNYFKKYYIIHYQE